VILAEIYIAGFAGLLMLFAMAHAHLLPIGGLFNPKATPWMLVIAALWPIAIVLCVIILAIGTVVKSHLEKEKTREEGARKDLVHAGRGEMPIHPPYDGSQKRRRYWKKVRFK
jgi:hypothetical protein